MERQPAHDSSDEQTLDAVIADYLQAVDRGDRPDRARLIEANPQHEGGLEAFFADQDGFAAAAAEVAEELPPASRAADAVVYGSVGSSGSAASDPNAQTLDDVLHQPPDPLPGEFVRYFGDYELLQEIARGGMGVVYEAKQISLNRAVALKMILAGQLATNGEVKRFHQEAEAAANLDHPHIVPIHEVGQYKGRHYFTMKLIEGGPLSEHLPRLKGDLRGGAVLMAKVARAVHFAHQRGILHRDLKPANVLLDAKDEPHVTDFGLAKRVDADAGLTITRPGGVVGTPAYMPPEQARGEKELTTAADVYSLGAILYALLTGQPPFRAKTPLDTMRKLIDEEPPAPRSINRAVPRDLETICLRCLEKDPSRRYASADELARELDRWLRHEPIEARRLGVVGRLTRWARRNPALAATFAIAAGVLLLMTVGYYINLRSEQADLLSQYRNMSAWRHHAEVQTEIGKDALARAKLDQAQAVLSGNKPGKRWEALDLLRQANDLRRRPIDIFLEERADIQRTFPRRLVATRISTGTRRRDELHPDLREFLKQWRPLPVVGEQEKWENPMAVVAAKTLETTPALLPSAAELRSQAITAILTPDAREIARMDSGFGLPPTMSADGRYAACIWTNYNWMTQFVQEGVKGGPDLNKMRGGLRVFDTTLGKQTAQFELPMATPFMAIMVQLDPSGRWFVGQETEGCVLRSMADGSMVRVLDGTKGLAGAARTFGSFTFLPDGKTLVAMETITEGFASDGGVKQRSGIAFWHLEDGKRLRTIDLGQLPAREAGVAAPTGLAAGPGGNKLVVRLDKRRVRVLDIPYGDSVEITLPAEIQLAGADGMPMASSAMTMDPSEKAIAFQCYTESSRHPFVLVWDIAQAKEKYRSDEFEGFPVLYPNVAFSPDGKLLALGTFVGDIAILDAETGRELWRISNAHEIVATLRWSADGDHLVTAGLEGGIKRWRLTRETAVRELPAGLLPKSNVNWHPISPDGRFVAVGAHGVKETRLIELSTGRLVHTFDRGGEPCFSRDMSKLAIVQQATEKRASVFDLKTYAMLLDSDRLPAELAGMQSLGFDEEGHLCIFALNDGRAIVWDATTNKVQRDVPYDPARALFANLPPKARFNLEPKDVALPTTRSSVLVTDLTRPGKPRQLTLPPDIMPMSEGRVSPDDRWAAVDYMGGTLHGEGNETQGGDGEFRTGLLLYRLDGSQPPIDLGGRDPVTGAAFSPDSKWLALTHRRRGVALYSLPDVKEVFRYASGPIEDSVLDFTPDGRHLLIGDGKNFVRVMDLRRLKEDLKPHGLEW